MHVNFYNALLELQAAVKDGNRTIRQGQRYHKAVKQVVAEFEKQTFATEATND